MTGKATLDLSQRRIGTLRLLWNRVTPTRGAKKLSRSISSLAKQKDVSIEVKSDMLRVNGTEIPGSKFFAKYLEQAGIQTLEFKQGTPQKQVKKTLNLLTDNGLGKLVGKAAKLGLEIAAPPEAHPMLPTSWVDLYDEIAGLKKPEPMNLQMYKRIAAVSSVIVSIKIYQATNNLPAAISCGMGGLLATYLSATIINETALLPKRLKHLYFSARFPKDYQHLVELAQGSEEHAALKVLMSIRNRLYPSRKGLRLLTEHFCSHWGIETLDWARSHDIIHEEKLLELPRVIALLDEAANSTNAERLSVLASLPFWQIRRQVALNPNTPENILGDLVNKDPEYEVRKAVAENPIIIAMLAQARTSTSPAELSEMAKKPFPCVRAEVARNPCTPAEILHDFSQDKMWSIALSAAENPSTPWESVSLFLSKIRKDIKETGYDDTKVKGPCGDAMENITKYYRHGYFAKNFEIAKKIMDIHQANRVKILESLKKRNKELYRALLSQPSN